MDDITPDELRLLRSYADGPRIWDAASLVPTVHRLEDLGLIERKPTPEGGSSARQLTARGRQVLAGRQ